jgi:hypothetical protein
MSDKPDTTWDKEDRKRTQECIDATAKVAQEPKPRVWPISGRDAKGLDFGRLWSGAKTVPSVTIEEEE